MSNPQPTASTKLSKLTETFFSELDTRSRDVLSRRFGVASDTVETLESIGKEYGITRERVRQIESQAKKAVMGLRSILAPVEKVFDDLFHRHGGILAQRHVVRLVREQFSGDTLSAPHIVFYLELLPQFEFITRDAVFNPHWRFKNTDSAQAVTLVKTARAILKDHAHPLPDKELLSKVRQLLATAPETLPTEYIHAQLIASKTIGRTPFGEWGLVDWPETTPRGVGDKAYTVLRRHATPEHFTRITELINEAAFDHKRANAQTVHNELIKDSRFVLVGRGLYGLAEWGYIPGTVGDVLESLLARAKHPLSREELIEQVLAQRKVKKNTILLGLQNEKRFVKTPENRYTLKEKS